MSSSRALASISPLQSFAEGYTVHENPNLPINVSTEELPTERSLWKSDRICMNCKSPFKLLQHKYRCKFCYRGVCSKCSGHTFLHPELGVHKRCCNNCYSRFVTSTIREELAGKIYTSQGRLTLIEDQLATNLQRKRENEEVLRDLEGELRRRRLKLTNIDRTFERELLEQKERLVQVRRAKDQIGKRQRKVIERIEELRSQSEHKRREKEEHVKTLSQCEEHTRTLKSQLSELQEEASHMRHAQATRSQSLSPEETQKVSPRSTHCEDEEVLDTEASASKDCEEESYEMGSPALNDADPTLEPTHLQRLLTDLQAENSALRHARCAILSERTARGPQNRQGALVQPNRSCCSLF